MGHAQSCSEASPASPIERPSQELHVVRRSRHATGVEKSPGDCSHTIDVILPVILQQDADVCLSQRYIYVIHPWNLLAGNGELLDQWIVEPQRGALLNQGLGEGIAGDSLVSAMFGLYVTPRSKINDPRSGLPS